jgi:hypothetical protein
MTAIKQARYADAITVLGTSNVARTTAVLRGMSGGSLQRGDSVLLVLAESLGVLAELAANGVMVPVELPLVQEKLYRVEVSRVMKTWTLLAAVEPEN